MLFIIGTAGSGKSLFTSSFSEWLKISKQDVAIVNLDPGALKLPYSPDVDIRNYVDVGNIMETYELGPNGALILAADLIADKIDIIGPFIPCPSWWTCRWRSAAVSSPRQQPLLQGGRDGTLP